MREALIESMKCETCEGEKTIMFPPSCNCYGDPVCTHKEIEGECPACEGTGFRDVSEAVNAALAAARAAVGDGK